MDYKQKYEELYERISNLVRDYDCVSGLIDVREELKSILNESQESEDERIRKEMIDFMSSQLKSLMPPCPSNEKLKTWIAWLERKGELKSTKPAWSEEDEYILETLFIRLNNEQENYPQLSLDFQEIQEIKAWLESLKDRVQSQPKPHWKPSEEQMETIQEILTVDCPPNFRKRVESLYTDLKKL